MSFKSWLQLNEMPHFSGLDGKMSIPCGAVKAGAAGLKMPCVDKPVGMIDMRFEDHPPPFNKLGPNSKFAAQIPGSSEYLIYHGNAMIGPEIILGNKALQMGYLPEDQTPGATSEKGYILAPKDWFMYAQIFDTEYNVIKPPLSVVNGKRDS
jgi:hypothetical protein